VFHYVIILNGFKTITIRKTAEITVIICFGYSKLFLPKALNIVAQLAGLLAYSIFAAFPSRVIGTVA
jgi:hypothetical protein